MSIDVLLIMVIFLVEFLTFAGITFLFKVILPSYKISTSEISLEELFTVLNAVINTELELWEKDVFKENKSAVGTNARYDNFYHEICGTIVSALSPSFFVNINKFITDEEVVSIIARRVKIFLNEYTGNV